MYQLRKSAKPVHLALIQLICSRYHSSYLPEQLHLFLNFPYLFCLVIYKTHFLLASECNFCSVSFEAWCCSYSYQCSLKLSIFSYWCFCATFVFIFLTHWHAVFLHFLKKKCLMMIFIEIWYPWFSCWVMTWPKS